MCGRFTGRPLEPKQSEVERLRVALREITDTATHAGPVCGRCHSNIGRASKLIEIAKTALRGEEE
jgi:hypothetical protein